MTTKDLVICLPVGDDRQMAHSWGRAARVAIVRTRDGAITQWDEHAVAWDELHDAGTEGAHHARVVRFLRDEHVTTVIAQHMGPGMQNTLGKMGIDVHLGTSGSAEVAALAVAGA